MDTLTVVNNKQTTVNTLSKLIKWFLIANASQTRIFKGNGEKIYSYKKILQSSTFADLPETVKDELTAYLKKHFEIVKVEVTPIAYNSVGEIVNPQLSTDINLQQYGNFVLDVDISVTTSTGVEYTLKEAIKTNVEQEMLFRKNTR